MTQLYSDLIDGSGRRYYYSLTRAPGGASPASQALLTVVGQMPTIFQQVSVFRTPTQAIVTLLGYQPPALTPVQPGVGAVTLSGLIPTEQKIRVITNALPTPDYSTPDELTPTIIYIQTITPTTAALQIQALTLNAFPGGDIGYVNPGVGLISTGGLQATLVNNQPDIGLLTMVGQVPVLATSLTIEPDIATLSVTGNIPDEERPFTWIDVDPPPTTPWTTTTGIAA